jgi:hypothetical protein
MAIIVEEEQRSPVSIVAVAAWLAIVGVVGAAVYYLFVKSPERASYTAPEQFKNTAVLSKVTLEPDRLMRSPAFQRLKQYIALPQPTKVGRENPMLGF